MTSAKSPSRTTYHSQAPGLKWDFFGAHCSTYNMKAKGSSSSIPDRQPLPILSSQTSPRLNEPRDMGTAHARSALSINGYVMVVFILLK